MICEKCGFVPSQPGKFCEKCGSPLVAAPVQEEPIPEETFAVFNDVLVSPIQEDPKPLFDKIQEAEVQEEALVYNPEVVAGVVTGEETVAVEQEPIFAPIQVELSAAAQEAPATPIQAEPSAAAQDIPAAPVQEAPAVSFQTPPAGAPLFSAPAYHGAIPNAVPTYYGNAPAYNAQGYPNMPGYYGVPVYGGVAYGPNGQPAYAAAPQQGYAPAAPVYYAPTAQPEAVPAPDNSLASNKKAAKKFSGLAFVGAIIALMSLFFEVISSSGRSIFDFYKNLPDLFEDFDRITSMEGIQPVLEIVLLVCGVLLGVFALVLFFMACFKVNCRPMAIICLVTVLVFLVAVCWSNIAVLPDAYWRNVAKDHELVEGFLRVPGSGAWLYILGALLAAFGRNRKNAGKS